MTSPVRLSSERAERNAPEQSGVPPLASAAPKPSAPAAEQLRMVGWYDPGQLVQTGVDVAISTIFGRHSDHRLVEAMAAGDDQVPFFDYTCFYIDEPEDCRPDSARPRDEIWIDYVGDVGDGWNSTYAIASHLAEAGRTFTYTDPATGPCKVTTERGAILVFGGDEVYPTPSQAEYKRRLTGPYETALRNTDPPHPHAFAIPGNHDWYDSLVSFNRLFTSRRWFAGWRTRQTRSYFALKLPHNWWLLGTDMQLGSDIDGPQVSYFERLVPEMQAETERTGKPASVILCHAEPHWVRAAQYGGYDPNYSESNLKLLERRLGKDVAVFIAGDLHHYRRHEAQDRSTQKITAGGGGAFLHPTHVGALGTKVDRLEERDTLTPESSGTAQAPDQVFELRASFPPEAVSRKLTWWNLLFPYLPGSANRWLGAAIGGLYLLLTMSVIADIDQFVNLRYSFATVAGTGLREILNSGVTAALVGLVLIGFIVFTDTHSRPYRIIMGGLHGFAHVGAAFAIAALSVMTVAHYLDSGTWTWTSKLGGLDFNVDARMPVAVLPILVGGYFAGPLVLGVYLLFSLNLFGRHSNEAFSSLGIQDWKNTLRLHVDRNGDLTIYPIGIERVPRRWKPRSGPTGPELVSDDPQAKEPTLIEPPIVIRRSSATATGCEASTRPRA